MPEILGGGTTDFIASSIYDSFFQISNPGLGAALSMILVTLGSVVVTIIFFMAGTGTLGFSRRVE
jgi:putative spermidine/putrescine transport system permease protein